MGQWFVRKLCFNILMGYQYKRPWLKGQRSTFLSLSLYTAIRPRGHTMKDGAVSVSTRQ